MVEFQFQRKNLQFLNLNPELQEQNMELYY